MFTRYAMLTGLVVVVALAAGVIVHEAVGHTTYAASCDFQLALPSTATVPSSDILAFNRRQANDEIARAQLGKVWDAVGRKTKVPPSEVAADQSVTQVSDSSFSVNVTNPDPYVAIRLANALCDQYVTQLSSQVQAEQSNEVNGLRSQIAHLEHQLHAPSAGAGRNLTPAQQVERATLTGAIQRNEQVLVVALSLPPDNISVLSRASDVSAKSTKPSLSKSLIIAAAAGLLASFLVILAVDASSGRRLELERR
jgi:capsular polysaccharide biosynthesis protein